MLTEIAWLGRGWSGVIDGPQQISKKRGIARIIVSCSHFGYGWRHGWGQTDL